MYIPPEDGLRQEIVQQCHDAPTAGHLGKHGTLELVSRLYWWPGISGFVEKYVLGCDQCQRYKAAAHPRATLQPHEVPEAPWTVIGVDLITGLPPSKGKNVIATYVDLYSKQVHLVATTDTVTADSIGDLHYQHIFRLHGIPRKIVLD